MSDQPQQQLYAAPADYDLLVEALAKRRLEKNISFALLDEAAELPDGYTAKCLGGSQTRRLGFKSMFKICKPLGLRLVIEVDEAAAAEFAEMLQPRNAKEARPGNFSARVSDRTVKRAVRHMVQTYDWREIIQTISETRRTVADERAAKEAREPAAAGQEKSPAPRPKRVYVQSAKTRLRNAIAVSAAKRAKADRNKTSPEKSDTARNDSTERAGAI